MRLLHHPSREEIILTNVLYAFSDPLRLKIVMDLAGQGEMTCGAFPYNIAKSTLSHHFKVLREAGVINTRIEGTQRYICLRTEDLEARFPGLMQAILNVP